MIWRKYILRKENQVGQFIVSPTLLHKRFRMTKPRSLMLHKSGIFFLTEIYMGIDNFFFFPLNCLRLKFKKFFAEGIVSIYKICLLGVEKTTAFMLEFKVHVCLALLLNPNLVFSPYTKSSLLSMAYSFLVSYGMWIVIFPDSSASAEHFLGQAYRHLLSTSWQSLSDSFVMPIKYHSEFFRTEFSQWFSALPAHNLGGCAAGDREDSINAKTRLCHLTNSTRVPRVGSGICIFQSSQSAYRAETYSSKWIKPKWALEARSGSRTMSCDSLLWRPFVCFLVFT